MKWLFWPKPETVCEEPGINITISWTDSDTEKQWGNLVWTNGETKEICPTDYGCDWVTSFPSVFNYEQWRFFGENYDKTYTQTPYGGTPPTSVPTYSAATGIFTIGVGGFYTNSVTAGTGIRKRYGFETLSIGNIGTEYHPPYTYTPPWTTQPYYYPGYTETIAGRLRMRQKTYSNSSRDTATTIVSSEVSTKWLAASSILPTTTSAIPAFMITDSLLSGYVTFSTGLVFSWQPADSSAFGACPER